MIQTIIGDFLNTKKAPPKYDAADAVEVYQKVQRILSEATLPTHVDAAERLFGNMLKRFGFNEEQRQSPLIVGIQDQINIKRASWDAM